MDHSFDMTDPFFNISSPITSFLQAEDTLGSVETIDSKAELGWAGNDKTKIKIANKQHANQVEKADKNLERGHCAQQQLPDFFGFKVPKGILTPQVKVGFDWTATYEEPETQPEPQPQWLRDWAERKSDYNPHRFR
jgi:hypothetical protein